MAYSSPPTRPVDQMAVCDYVLTDPLDPAFKEATTHLIIYHADLDGRRELYRHFLRMPDGTAMEMFGDLSQHFGGGFGAKPGAGFGCGSGFGSKTGAPPPRAFQL